MMSEEIIKEASTSKEDLIKLLKQNTELNQQILDSCQKTEKYIFKIKLFGYIKFIIIILPLIIGVFYLVPFLNDFMGIYRKMLGDDVLDGIKNLNRLGI